MTDQLRQAAQQALEWDERRNYVMPYKVRDALRSALAAPQAEPVQGDDLDDDHPLWLVNAQINGLLEGVGAPEDHDNVIAFLTKTGLPTGTVARVHKAVVCAEKKAPQAEPVAIPSMTSKVVNDACWEFVKAMPHALPGPIFNDLKPALYAALKHYHAEVLAHPAPAPQAEPVGVVEIDYKALVEAAWARHKYAAGTNGCVAFKRGAEWFRDACSDTHPAPAADVVRDAERYRWLREQSWLSSGLCVVKAPKENVRLGAFCPSECLLDEAIDAAMKGADHE